MDYDAFYQSCLPKMDFIMENVFKKDASMGRLCALGITPLAATLDKFVYAVGNSKGVYRAFVVDHEGSTRRDLFNGKPVDLDITVERMTATYYDQLSKKAALQAQEAEKRLFQRQQVKLEHLPLFKTIVKELYGLDWRLDGWTLQPCPHAVQLYKEGKLTVEMPIGWLSMSQEETLEILRVFKRCDVRRHTPSPVQLPKSLTKAWIDLENASYRAHFHALPEIFAWIDEQSVPHVCVLGVTASGHKNQPVSDVVEILGKKIAVAMPYDTKLQPRMLDALIQICREKTNVYVNEVISLIPDEAIRESTREQLLKIRSDKTPYDH